MGGALGAGAHLVDVLEGTAQGGLNAGYVVGEQECGNALAAVTKDLCHHIFNALLYCLDNDLRLGRVFAASAHCHKALGEWLAQMLGYECCDIVGVSRQS